MFRVLKVLDQQIQQCISRTTASCQDRGTTNMEYETPRVSYFVMFHLVQDILKLYVITHYKSRTLEELLKIEFKIQIV